MTGPEQKPRHRVRRNFVAYTRPEQFP